MWCTIAFNLIGMLKKYKVKQKSNWTEKCNYTFWDFPGNWFRKKWSWNVQKTLEARFSVFCSFHCSQHFRTALSSPLSQVLLPPTYPPTSSSSVVNQLFSPWMFWHQWETQFIYLLFLPFVHFIFSHFYNSSLPQLLSNI